MEMLRLAKSSGFACKIILLAQVFVFSGCILLFAGSVGLQYAAQAAPGSPPVDPLTTEYLMQNYEQSRRDLAQMMEKSTLFIMAFADDGAMFMGSGFVVADGYLMTNGHVVIEEGKRCEVYVMNEHVSLREARIMAVDYDESIYEGEDISNLGKNDFALLRFTPPAGAALPSLSFSTEASRMDRVSAWGYPGMVTQFDRSLLEMDDAEDIDDIQPPPVVYTEGTVSTLVKNRAGLSIIHTAAIAGGNSGGPLINRNGAVVGINTWGYTEEDEGAFVNASIPADRIISFLQGNGVQPSIIAVRPIYQDATSPGEAFQPAEPGVENGLTGNAAQGKIGNVPTIEPGKPESSRADLILLERLWPDGVPLIPGVTTPDDSRLSTVRAKELLARAQAGDAAAQAAAGYNYFNADAGFPEDRDAARFWLEKGAEQGFARAQGILGTLYLMEDWGSPDDGMALLEKSASANNAAPEIQAFLADMYYEGESLGVPFDAEEALKWAEKSAAANDPTGMAVLGFLYWDGNLVTEDLPRARRFAEASAAKGNPKGKALLALLLYDQSETMEEMARVIELAEAAAEGGEPYAQGLLALIYAFDSNLKNEVLAERFARPAAGQADHHGQLVLGWLYYQGIVVEKNLAMAWAYADLAAEKIGDQEIDGELLLKNIELQMTRRDRKQGEAIQKSWFRNWRLKS